MNKHLQHKITFALGGFLAFMVAILLVCMIAEGKNILFAEDFEGRIYSAERGYFEAGGKTYYAHQSKSAMYDKGELVTNAYRVRNNKLYYFGRDGAMLTAKTSRNKTTRYIDFNRDGSVHYIYPAGYGEPRERYNANHQRYQVRKHGKWIDTGMQCWPYGMIDWQW